jgi:prolyl 4-hydroxylase
MAPWAAGARGHSGGGIPTTTLNSGRLIVPPLHPGLPARISTHAAIVLIVLGFLLGRMTTPGALTHLPGSRAAAAVAPSSSSTQAAAAALPLPSLPPSIRALTAADQRHAQLTAAIARGEVDATSLLPDMGPLGRAWMRESGLLALRPPLPQASSAGSGGAGSGSSSSDSSSSSSSIGSYVVQPFQILSWQPRIVLFPNFIDAERRRHIVELASGRLEHSSLAWRPSEKADPKQSVRTSKGAFLSRHDDPKGALAWLEEKIAAVTYLPVSHGEAFNYLEYEEGAHYASHMDSFDPRDFGPQESQRLATVLVILDEPEAGGETIFLREGAHGDKRQITDWSDCSATAGGYRYAPRAGDALLFFSLSPSGQIDARALHGGCPVIGKKKKRVLTKWIRTRDASDWKSFGRQEEQEEGKAPGEEEAAAAAQRKRRKER